jgi:hypothetical protein
MRMGQIMRLIEILLIDYCKARGLLTEAGRLPKRR